MFVYSVRGSTVKFFAVIILTLAVLVGVLTLGTTDVLAASVNADISLGGVKTNEDRIAFLARLGVTVSGEPKEEVSFSVPENFDVVLLKYNEIQRSQGLDLSKYKNKKVTRYTYEAQGYGDYEGAVMINLIVYRNTVVACDASSIGPEGFVKPLISLK